MLIDLYEYELPVLSVNLTEIKLNLSQNYNGIFSIENIGGSILIGSIHCNNPIISFYPNTWESNFVTVDYTVDIESSISCLKDYKQIKDFIIIKSNGGEKLIPVTINIILDMQLDSLESFYNYYCEQPVEACNLFLTEKFKLWISKSNPNIFNIYNQLLIDVDKERAIDNFFRIIFNKPYVDIYIDNTNIEYYIKYIQKDEIIGYIKIKKSDLGYVSCQIIKHFDNTWLYIDKTLIKNSDFNKNGEVVITYLINKNKIIDNKVSAKLIFKTDISIQEVVFTVTKQPVLSIWLSKESFFFNDYGEVIIENNSGKTVEISILTKDSFIKFEAKKYYIDSFSKIPFYIKYVPKALSLFSLSKNKNVQSSEITIRTTIDKNIIRKKLKIIVVNS